MTATAMSAVTLGGNIASHIASHHTSAPPTELSSFIRPFMMSFTSFIFNLHKKKLKCGLRSRHYITVISLFLCLTLSQLSAAGISFSTLLHPLTFFFVQLCLIFSFFHLLLTFPLAPSKQNPVSRCRFRRKRLPSILPPSATHAIFLLMFSRRRHRHTAFAWWQFFAAMRKNVNQSLRSCGLV